MVASQFHAICKHPWCMALRMMLVCNTRLLQVDTRCVGAVPAVLDPALRAYDAYGLHHAADKPGREGHAISMMGAKEAQEAVQGLHKKFQVGPEATHLQAWRGTADVNAVLQFANRTSGSCSCGQCGGCCRKLTVCNGDAQQARLACK
jgi:hypothetical protein